MSNEPVVPVPTRAEALQCIDTLRKLRELADFHRLDGSEDFGPCKREDLVALYAAELIVDVWLDALA